MKIAMVGQYTPHIGGIARHINTLAKELIKEGHEVYVITYPHKDLKEGEITDIEGVHVIGTKGANIPGIRGIMFKRNAEKLLKKLVKEENIDIIHGHYLFPAGLVSVNVGKKMNIKTYVSSHGSDILELYRKQKFIQPTIKKVLNKADVVLAVSNALKNEILKIDVENISSKTRIHLNSVDINKFKPDIDNNCRKNLKEELKINNNNPILLFVGNVTKIKNIDLLIESKRELNTECNLVIVGAGNQLNELKEKVNNYKNEGLIDNVYFTCARTDVDKIIPASDLLILPSFNESFGIVLIEALACGKPVIGSDVGGINEIITEDVGLLINPYDKGSLIKAIDKILTDEELYNKFKSNARQHAEKYSKVELPYDELKK